MASPGDSLMVTQNILLAIPVLALYPISDPDESNVLPSLDDSLSANMLAAPIDEDDEEEDEDEPEEEEDDVEDEEEDEDEDDYEDDEVEDEDDDDVVIEDDDEEEDELDDDAEEEEEDDDDTEEDGVSRVRRIMTANSPHPSLRFPAAGQR
jgi:hypothetical protein